MLLLAEFSSAVLRNFQAFAFVIVATHGLTASALFMRPRVTIMRAAYVAGVPGFVASLIYCPACLGTYVTLGVALLCAMFGFMPWADVFAFSVETVAALVLLRSFIGIDGGTVEEEIRAAGMADDVRAADRAAQGEHDEE